VKRLGALVLLCAIERLAIAAPTWSVTWPTGWSDISGEAAQNPDMQTALKRLAERHATTELAVRVDTEGHGLQILYTAMPLEEDASTRAVVRGFERGARDAARKGKRELSYSQHEAGDTLVAEQSLDVQGVTVSMKWIAGADRDRMRAVQATCQAPAAVCTAAFGSLVLDPTGLEPLTSRSDQLQYRIGVLGGAAIAVLLGWAVIAWFRRYRPPRRPPSPT